MNKASIRYENQTAGMLEAFDKAAQDWGWTVDQGTGRDVDNSKEIYEATRAKLQARLDRLHAHKRRAEELEEKLASLQAKLAERGIEI